MGQKEFLLGSLGLILSEKLPTKNISGSHFFFGGENISPKKTSQKSWFVLALEQNFQKVNSSGFLWLKTTSWATHLPWNLQGRIYFVWKVLLRLGKHNQKSSKAFEEFLHITGVFYIHYIPYIYIYLPVVGGWTNPLEKIWSSKWETIFPK